MTPAALALQIITPDGRSLRKQEIDVVVLRRREKRFEVGSEVAIFPHHAPTLIRLPVAPLRYRRGRRTSYLAVAGGFAEIREDHVLIVTPRFAVVGSDEPEPSAKARRITEQWRQERADFQRGMIGYP
jgi:F-type H+-transporting ATPase subunit epsilon